LTDLIKEQEVNAPKTALKKRIQNAS
jgi:hypothetical protein